MRLGFTGGQNNLQMERKRKLKYADEGNNKVGKT